MLFIDRVEAGEQLAAKLAKYKDQAVIYALPRGGIIVGAEVARELEAPLDLILVRKIGHPYNPEYAIGAVAENGEPVFNESERVGVDEAWLENKLRQERLENERRRLEYFPADYETPDIKDKVAILVDDGIATGLTMEAAVQAIRQRDPQKIVVAVPVASAEAVENLQESADEVVTVDDPAHFLGAVGAHYQNFPQIEDEEVIEILADTRDELAGRA